MGAKKVLARAGLKKSHSLGKVKPIKSIVKAKATLKVVKAPAKGSIKLKGKLGEERVIRGKASPIKSRLVPRAKAEAEIKPGIKPSVKLQMGSPLRLLTAEGWKRRQIAKKHVKKIERREIRQPPLI